jgi:hypothetical protein
VEGLREETKTIAISIRTDIRNTEEKLLTKIAETENKLSAEIGQARTAIMEMSENVDAILDMYGDQQLQINKLANRIKMAKFMNKHMTDYEQARSE